VTFRIAAEYDKSLRYLATEQNVSLNTLVNQIFSKFVEQEVFAKKFGVLKISTDTFRRILSKISEKDIAELGIRAGSQEAKEFILFKWKKLDLRSTVEFLKFYFDYCGFGRADMQQSESEVYISVHHDLKEKGSLYLKHFVDGLIRSTLNKSCQTTITEDTVTINFQT
jgi:hypothetical protein